MHACHARPGACGLTEEQERASYLAGSEHKQGDEAEGLDGADAELTPERRQRQHLGMLKVAQRQRVVDGLQSDGQHQVVDRRVDIAALVVGPGRDLVGQLRGAKQVNQPRGLAPTSVSQLVDLIPDGSPVPLTSVRYLSTTDGMLLLSTKGSPSPPGAGRLAWTFCNTDTTRPVWEVNAWGSIREKTSCLTV